jgi:hypothetical protein
MITDFILETLIDNIIVIETNKSFILDVGSERFRFSFVLQLLKSLR